MSRLRGILADNSRAFLPSIDSEQLERAPQPQLMARETSLNACLATDVMFPPGDGRNPANKWTKMLAKFFKKHGHDVKSHDFRVTQATEFYKVTKDIVKTQQFIGHSKVETT